MIWRRCGRLARRRPHDPGRTSSPFLFVFFLFYLFLCSNKRRTHQTATTTTTTTTTTTWKSLARHGGRRHERLETTRWFFVRVHPNKKKNKTKNQNQNQTKPNQHPQHFQPFRLVWPNLDRLTKKKTTSDRFLTRTSSPLALKIRLNPIKPSSTQ